MIRQTEDDSANSPEVAKGVGGALGGGVAVLDPTHLERLLGHGGGHDAGTARQGSDSQMELHWPVTWRPGKERQY